MAYVLLHGFKRILLTAANRSSYASDLSSTTTLYFMTVPGHEWGFCLICIQYFFWNILPGYRHLWPYFRSSNRQHNNHVLWLFSRNVSPSDSQWFIDLSPLSSWTPESLYAWKHPQIYIYNSVELSAIRAAKSLCRVRFFFTRLIQSAFDTRDPQSGVRAALEFNQEPRLESRVKVCRSIHVQILNIMFMFIGT